jgi:uncharacterized membrane protein
MDLALVYPYCRGLGALLATVGGVYFYGDILPLIGFVGVAITLSAYFVEPLFSKEKIEFQQKIKILSIGIAIAGYLIVDKSGLQYFAARSYIPMLFILMQIMLCPFVFKNGRAMRELQSSKYIPFVASIFMIIGYWLVLEALSYSKLGYVVGARSSGIVFGGIFAAIVLKEKLSKLRWLTIFLVTVGIILMKIPE